MYLNCANDVTCFCIRGLVSTSTSTRSERRRLLHLAREPRILGSSLFSGVSEGFSLRHPGRRRCVTGWFSAWGFRVQRAMCISSAELTCHPMSREGVTARFLASPDSNKPSDACGRLPHSHTRRHGSSGGQSPSGPLQRPDSRGANASRPTTKTSMPTEKPGMDAAIRRRAPARSTRAAKETRRNHFISGRWGVCERGQPWGG